MLPFVNNEKFGTFSFYGQHSGKLRCPAFGCRVLRLSTAHQGV